MGITPENKYDKNTERHISIGLVAHVDSGKTTLSESILYLAGRIRKLGRVDHKDAYLDTYDLERERGITIFSKQAVFDLGNLHVTLLDTPGHVDFAAEMERTLQVLDYAILVVNGANGVQGHTRTLWNLLKYYEVPVFLFVNKMDQDGTDKTRVLAEIQKNLDSACIAFPEKIEDEPSEEFLEELATCDESVLEEYLENAEIETETIAKLIAERKVFPCYFGSALKVQGVKELLDAIETYAVAKSEEQKSKEQESSFGAKVYKISRDNQGNRLTHLKVTKGSLKVKEVLSGRTADGTEWEEKINQIRIYSGEKYEMVHEACTGMVCAVTGLSSTYPGEGLGTESESQMPVLAPVINYQVEIPEGTDEHKMLGYLRELEEEDPMLRVVWNEELEEIHVRLMGEVQTEVLKSLMKDRFGVDVTFGSGSIVYKETIRNVVEGVGHFEPLRHYAEVHLKLEPGELGSGITLGSECSEDMLDKNWQRLILTHLAEKDHRGVLTGSVLTDVKITLIAGKAHLKHTEGGDFRQSTYRAVRQGLMQADNVLLEPYYAFRLEIPAECVGRAMTDIQRMNGKFSMPETEGERAVIAGQAPVACMRDYQMEVTSYTRGTGILSCTLKGYFPCHDQEEIVEMYDYDPERDLENPTGSVFCAHGAGYAVPWDEVFDKMHIERQLGSRKLVKHKDADQINGPKRSGGYPSSLSYAEDKELEEIFIRTYGKIERKMTQAAKILAGNETTVKKEEEPIQEYVLVDGYNVIFAWEDLKELAKDNIEAARNKLMDILCNYQGYRKCALILVFDAYKVEGDTMEIYKYHNIHVVFTKEAETADQYIEKVVHQIGRRYHVTVVTSDGVEQVITRGQGGTLISSREFLEELEIVNRQIKEDGEKQSENAKNYLFDHMDEGLARHLKEVRLGRRALHEYQEEGHAKK